MNTLESYTIDTPFGDDGECSKFTIDDVLNPFTLHNVMDYGTRYALSLWVRTVEETGSDKSISIRGANIPVTNEWVYHEHMFDAYGADLKIYFNVPGVYYIYHPQLERGNVATDWSESPLDTEVKIKNAQHAADKASQEVQAYIKIFNDTIQNLVTNADGASLMTQTPDGGWTFCTADTEASVKAISELLGDFTDKTTDALDYLKSEVDKNNLSSYVVINNDDANNPFIELGTVVKDSVTNELLSGEFKLRITNKSIIFMQNNNPVAYIDNQQLYIEKAVIKQELSVGGFILKQHGSRNNVGFLWRGVTSNNDTPTPEPEPEQTTYTLTYKHSRGDVIQSGSDQTGPQECYALWIDGVEQGDLSAFSNPPRYITLTKDTSVGVVVKVASGDARSYVTFNGTKVAGNSSEASYQFNITSNTTVEFEWNQWLSGLTIQSYWNCYITTN